MKAILLAAGRGSRLGRYTEAQPKCLTELGGRSLIERQIETLRGAGIDDIVLATGYRAEMLRFDRIGSAHNPDWASTNMVETLFCAEQQFTDDIIVSYADIVYEPRVIRALVDATYDVSIVVDRRWRPYWEHRFDDPLSDAESMKIDDDGLITELGQQVDDIDVVDAQYIGLMRFRGTGVDALRETRRTLGTIPRPWMEKRPLQQAYMTDFLTEMILTGVPVHAIGIDGGWLEIDTESDFESAASMWNDGSIDRFFDPSAR